MQCGSLQCDTPASGTLEFVNFKMGYCTPYNIKKTQSGKVCAQPDCLTFYNGPDRTSAHLVPNGASCDTDTDTGKVIGVYFMAD